MDTVAVGVGHLTLIRQWIQPAAGVGRAAGIAVRALIVVLPVQRCNALRLFLGQGSVIRGLGLGNILGERGLVCHILLVVGAHFLIGFQHISEQNVLLRTLGLELLLLLVELVAGRVKLRELLFELRALGRDLLGDGLHLVQHQLVGLGDLLNDVDLVEQIREAVCAEQDRPVGDITRLLHGADAGLVLLVQALFLGLRRFELGLLVGDKQTVLLHLLVEVVDSRQRHVDLLVDIRFLVDERLGLGLVFLDLCLKRVALLFELRLLIAKAGELFFDLRARRGVDHDGKGAGNQAQQHHGGQHQADDPAAGAAFLLFHK